MKSDTTYYYPSDKLIQFLVVFRLVHLSVIENKRRTRCYILLFGKVGWSDESKNFVNAL